MKSEWNIKLLAEDIVKYITIQNISQAEFARRVGTSSSTISRILLGIAEKPSIEIYVRACSVMKRPVKTYCEKYEELYQETLNMSTIDKIKYTLKSDENLTQKAKDNIAYLMRVAYDTFVKI